jgi:broad specificity phosphatase PhoE
LTSDRSNGGFVARSVLFICQAETAELRKGRFPAAEQAARRPLDAAVELAERLGSFDLVYCAPQQAARDTADVMFKTALIAPELKDIDYGRWSGRLIREVALEDDVAFQSWVGGAPSPGGESLQELIDRIAKWLDARMDEVGNTAAIVSPAVLRAVVISALNAPLQSFSRLDISALSNLRITSDGKRRNIHLAP